MRNITDKTSREKDALGQDLPARLGFPKTVGRDLALHQQFYDDHETSDCSCMALN